MKPTITGKKKKGSAAGASSGKGHAPGAGEKRRRETKSAADDDDLFMSVPSFENDGKELDLGGAGPAWKTYDWQGETSARENKRARDARAGSERADADAGRSKEKKKRSKEPVVNRVKPPRPEKKVKVDMRFGSEADKKKLADERFDERREAKRQKYAALSAAAAERDGDDANEVEPGISGKVLGRRRRAAEKRARAAEKRRADRLERGLPVTRPVKPLPAKLAVGTAAGVSALAKGGDDAGSKNKNAKRKERREKARTARDAEDAKAQVTPGFVPGDATTATRDKAEAAIKPNPDRSAKGAPEESAKARARREKREAAEALERRAAALREAAAADSDSDSDGSDEDAASPSGGAGEGGDWGEAFSSDEDDGEIDSDEDAALDAAFAESDDDDDAEGASPSGEEDSGEEDSGEEDSGEEDSGEEEDPDAFEKARARDPMKKKPSLVDKMRAKLSGGQFRMLNEALYTTTGDKALRMVEDQPGMFSAYHAGFREQTKEWPVRPVDACLKWLATLPKTLRVADFGCGDAELARRAPQKTVHSFDLESEAEGVVACNMANVPLEDASVEVAVFSLSLMGTDYGSFMEEAHRVRARHSTATGGRVPRFSAFFFFRVPKDFRIPERRRRRETRARTVFARPSADDGRVLFTRARTHRRTLPFHRRVITMSPPAGRSPDTFLHPSLRRDAASSERNAD
jgi:ribosomal RNA-processing protein 8